MPELPSLPEPPSSSPNVDTSSRRLWLGIGAAVLATIVVAILLLVVVRADGGGYDEATRDRFLEACTAEGGDAVAGACTCLYERIEATLPFERFEEVDRALADEQRAEDGTLPLPGDVQALLDSCLAEPPAS